MSATAPAPARRPRGARLAALRARIGPAGFALGGILLLALVLRVWSIRHGLPFVYNFDESNHFVPRAVKMVGGSLNPHYFENPPSLTYLFFAVFKLRFHAGFPFGSHGFAGSFRHDPTQAFLTARLVVALLGTLAAGLVCWAGTRFYDRRVGLIAAALIACSFLPVFYSKHALNDVVTLVPLTAGLVGCLLVYERGTLFDWALAGGAVGAAAATKYTAGAMLVTLGIAALLRLVERRDPLRRVLIGLVAAGAFFGLLFVLLNPFALVDFSQFKSQVGGQSSTAGGSAKLGQSSMPGWLYYVWTLTWGFGWLPALAAAAGAVLAFGRERGRALLLIVFPLLMFLFLGAQARHFGRWFLPAYPALAVLAAYGTVRAVEALPAAWGRRSALLVAAGVLLVLQGVASSVRVDSVLAKADTRTLAGDWMARHVPQGSGVVIEPAVVPKDFLALRRRSGPTAFRQFPIKPPFQAYEKKLQPGLIDTYRAQGYCWVVVASYQHDRGLEANLPNARAYYARLASESKIAATFSPYRSGADPVGFNFDFSFDYLPRAYLRPGPLLEIHRLGSCRS